MNAAATLLIVDDIELNRNLLRDFVISLGHEPMLAVDGPSALAAMKESPPDLVLLDILMPEMDGHEVLSQMKADEALRALPVIVVSALDDMPSVFKAIEAGADDYLTKPVNLGLLRARLGASLDKKRLRDRERKLHAELEGSYQDLKKAERDRDMLTRMVVHDLNNPLTNIMGYADLLIGLAASGPIAEDKLLKYLEIIARASTDMARLTQTILDTAKLESGLLNASVAPLDAVSLVAEVCATFATRAEKARIHLVYPQEVEPTRVLADRDLLTRVLQNLLANALKHPPRGSTVTVSLEREAATVVLTVADDGPGIPGELQEQVFDEFFQIELKNAGVMRGVGLGLTFCKLATEAQGGKICLESTPGEGARFRVQLPAAE